jgi:hypothetical protein
MITVKHIRVYLAAEIILSVVYIILLSCHIVYELPIQQYAVTFFGPIRLFKSILMIFISYEIGNNLYFYNKNIMRSKEQVFERKATLNIEKVLQILAYFKDKVFGIERENIDYCIKIITNNKLFIPQIFEEDKNNNTRENMLKNEIAFWVQNFEKIEKIINDDNLPSRERSRIDTSRKVAEELRSNEIEKLNVKISKFIDDADSNKIVKALMNAFNLDFNVFLLKEACNSQELLALMYYVFYHLDYFHIFNIRTHKFINFAKKVQSSYHKNPYHNATHGADIMQVREKL